MSNPARKKNGQFKAGNTPVTLFEIHDLQKQLWKKLTETDSKAQAGVIRICNLQTEIHNLENQVQSLLKAVLQSNQVMLRLLQDPEIKTHAQALAAKEFHFNKE